ncbi:MAG: tryptophan-rich sensory protein [Flavobacteriaceae bacterium]|nr:tryptophan-rich sensory protein [Bacteroidia bacterium]MBT8287908.1 tryptophan-rich sensory protein [Bacteroidia bacterium]NNF74526.1 tryptophan-rich sensory protein [Flavobacteriaceae bacterium]NNK72123.1 tryptophan-rich sensory protein [Flavobacteriaceae bacterium]
MKRIALFALFFVLNFGGLAIGNWLMNNGPSSPWYIALNKAPWTPPGWVFGAAWTIIMICFSIYLANLFQKKDSIKLRQTYFLALLINISWNYVFFNQHLIGWALINIILLTILIFYFFFRYNDKTLKRSRLLLLPYMIWLCLATSLNAYILIYN